MKNLQVYLLICSIIMMSFSIGMYTATMILTGDTEGRISKSNGNISGDIFAFSEMINDKVNDFFYYNISNIDTKLTDEQLKEQGGVCWHYTDYYIEQTLNQTNFYAQKVSININETTKHAFAVISNDDGYCILDETERWCVA